MLRPNESDEFQESARWVLAGYYAHVTALDHAIGDLLAAIDMAGISDKTIFVFISEHEDMFTSKGVMKKTTAVGCVGEVPMLIRHPQKFTLRRIKNPTGTPDLLPMLLVLSGIKIPKSVEGEDFSQDLLIGKDISSEAALIEVPVRFHEWRTANGGREYRVIRIVNYTYA